MLSAALIQLRVTDDVEKNLTAADKFIDNAASAGNDLIVLPEMFACPYSNAAFVKNAEPSGGRTTQMLAAAAARTGKIIIGGSMPQAEDGKIYNTCFVFDGTGACVARHRKLHLFDIEIENGQSFKESETLSRGDEITVFDTPFGKIGVCICFDLRFPELFRAMAKRGARAIVVPAAFNMTTGPLHWELLFRARAVDYQLFMLGCAPARDKNQSYVSYANSIIVNPWGKVIGAAGDAEGVLSAGIDLDEVDSVRRQIPTASALRNDIYSV